MEVPGNDATTFRLPHGEGQGGHDATVPTGVGGLVREEFIHTLPDPIRYKPAV